MIQINHPIVRCFKAEIGPIAQDQELSVNEKINKIFEKVTQYADRVYARSDRASIIMRGIVQICHLFPTEGDIRANKVAMKCLKGLIQGEEGFFCGLSKMGVFIHADRNGWYETGTTCAELKDYRTVLAKITDFKAILSDVKSRVKNEESTLQNLDFLRQVIESARDLEKHDIAKQIVEHIEKYLKDTSEIQFFYKWLLFKRFYSVTPADKSRIAEYKENDEKRRAFLESVMQQAQLGLGTISKADITVLCELRLVLKQDEYIQRFCLDLEKALRGSLAKVDRSHQLFPVINSSFRLSTEDDLEDIIQICLDGKSEILQKTPFENYVMLIQTKLQDSSISLKKRMMLSIQDVMLYMRSIDPGDKRIGKLQGLFSILNAQLAESDRTVPLGVLKEPHTPNSVYKVFLKCCGLQNIKKLGNGESLQLKLREAREKYDYEIHAYKIALVLSKCPLGKAREEMLNLLRSAGYNIWDNTLPEYDKIHFKLCSKLQGDGKGDYEIFQDLQKDSFFREAVLKIGQTVSEEDSDSLALRFMLRDYVIEHPEEFHEILNEDNFQNVIRIINDPFQDFFQKEQLFCIGIMFGIGIVLCNHDEKKWIGNCGKIQASTVGIAYQKKDEVSYYDVIPTELAKSMLAIGKRR